MLNKSFSIGLATLLSSVAFPCFAASEETPVMTFHTSLYEQAGAANTFTFYLGAKENTYIDVDCGFGKFETEVEVAYFDSDSSAIKGTPVTCTVSSEGIVKIYGDASMIDYIDMEGCYITSIEWPEMTEVEILNLNHNLFTSLDISHMTKLQALYADDIPCTETTPFIVGASKPNLQIASISMVEWLDPEFDITGYPELRAFTAYSTPSLRRIDPTHCPNLMQLSVDATNVESVDVSKNPYLLILNVSETKVTELDLSNNPFLSELYAQHEATMNYSYKLNSIDISKNPEIVRLYVAGNRLTELDLSNTPKLHSLNCRGNLIPALSFENKPDLTLVDVSNNLMNFNTCPVPQATYSDYIYQQSPIQMERSYKAGKTLDFLAQVIRQDSNTEAVLYAVNGNNPTEQTILGDEYFAFENGVVTLKKEYSDSVYVAFKNTIFPDWTLTTTPFMVKSEADFGKPSRILTLTPAYQVENEEFYVGIAGASEENPVTFHVDFGDGSLVEFEAASEGLPLVANVSGKRTGNLISVWMPENADISAFKVADMPLDGINLSAARSLKILEVTGCSLQAINLDYNRSLTRLDLSGNNLSYVNLAEPNESFLKTLLGDINLSDNRLSSMALVDNYGLRRLDVSGNLLTEIPLQHAVGLTYLDISDNQIPEISLSDCESLVYLDMSGNSISELLIPDYVPLDYLDISRNLFTLATLPAPGAASEYFYAPQAVINIPTKAPSVNLSSQYVTVDGNTTRYEWLMAADNTPVTEGISANNGRFIFTDPEIGLIYCSITNDAFPALSGENALKTTQVMTADIPTNKFAEFVTAEDGTCELSMAAANDATAIYIDWTGEGDLEQYVLGTSYTVFEAQTVKDTRVGCYSYDEIDGVTVFSLSNAPMKSMDASAMKSVRMFGLSDSFIPQDQLKLPVVESLDELRLDNNGFTSFSPEKFPNLYRLSLDNNELTSLDVKQLPKLQTLYVSGNKLKELSFNNPNLWEVMATGNSLESVDLSGAPVMEQLWLSHNSLSSIDVSASKSLRVLTIDNNRFDLSTLPVPAGYYLYSYTNQAPLSVEVKEGTVDLTSQAKVGASPTTFAWYIDTPYFDENDVLTGEELYVDEEYTLEDGVTTFLKSFNHIMCVMTNPIFPNLYLYTDFINVIGAGVAETAAAGEFSVTLRGGELIVNADVADGTVASVYGLDGRLVDSAIVKDGVAVLAAPSGVTVVSVGGRAAKINVK